MLFYTSFTKKFNKMSTLAPGYLKTLQIMFMGLFTGPILFLGVCFMLQAGSQPVEQEMSSPLFFIAIGFATIGIIGSRAMYASRISKLQALESTQQKLDGWRTTFIIRMAMIEGPTLLCVVGLLIEEQRVFLFLALVLLFFQALNFPTKSKIQSDLNLSETETKEL